MYIKERLQSAVAYHVKVYRHWNEFLTVWQIAMPLEMIELSAQHVLLSMTFWELQQKPQK